MNKIIIDAFSSACPKRLYFDYHRDLKTDAAIEILALKARQLGVSFSETLISQRMYQLRPHQA